VDTILLGRVTYELLANYWLSSSPSTNEIDPIIIDKMNNLPKIVFSNTLEKAEWKNTRLIKRINAEEILKMKKQPGKNMMILGSGSIVSALTNLGLIDENLLVTPVVLGRGKPLFKDLNSRQKLKLIKTKTFRSGVVALNYQLIPDQHN
jgi:dihydrofolate reductase